MKRRSLCGISSSLEILTIYESTYPLNKVYDRKSSRTKKVHGSSFRAGLSSAGGRNIKTLYFSRIILSEVRILIARIREQERVELDRHSYEVQIK